MLKISTQTKNVVYDSNPAEGFALLKRSGFDCADFSLNSYLTNLSLYRLEQNAFFDQTDIELENFFSPHKKGAQAVGVRIHQLHMPYPLYVPNADRSFNAYLMDVVARKSMRLCAFFNCPYIVVHGFKLSHYLGSEEAEWAHTESFLDSLASLAKELGLVICLENLYNRAGKKIMEGPCCHAAKAVQRIDRLNDKHGAELFGFCFDTGHANLVGLDFEQFITTLGSRLKVLHIHDNDGVADLHQLPFTFTKTRENLPSTDWDGFLRGLRAIHYRGSLSFETAPVLNSFPVEIKEDVLKLIAKTGRYFASQIAAAGDT